MLLMSYFCGKIKNRNTRDLTNLLYLTYIILQTQFMVQKVGETAGKVWTALRENGKMTTKELKKVTKAKTEKEILLALGWLLREDNIVVEEVEKDLVVTLK